jgi:peptide/nickel transport system ATP-binding protein
MPRCRERIAGLARGAAPCACAATAASVRRRAGEKPPFARTAAARFAGDAAPCSRCDDLKVHFPIRAASCSARSAMCGGRRRFAGISAGRTLALVGESGCGKTTVGKACCN